MNDKIDPEQDHENMLLRLISMIIVALLLSFANTLLGVITVAQFVVMLVNRRQPNEQLAEFATKLGMWMAKAAMYQTGASEVKPWPWTMLD
jgi:hypothetical protein